MPTFRSSEFGWDLLRRRPEMLISIVILEAAEGEVAYPAWQSTTHTQETFLESLHVLFPATTGRGSYSVSYLSRNRYPDAGDFYGKNIWVISWMEDLIPG